MIAAVGVVMLIANVIMANLYGKPVNEKCMRYCRVVLRIEGWTDKLITQLR